LTIGERIRELRVNQRLAISDVVTKTGLSRGSISMIENGKNDPSAKAIIQLSELFGVTADWLLTGRKIEKTHIMFEDRVFGHSEKTASTTTLESSCELLEVPVVNILEGKLTNDVREQLGTLSLQRLIVSKPDNYRVFIIRGHNFEPDVMNGDIVLIRCGIDWFHADDRICAVANAHRVILGRLHVDEGKQFAILNALNRQYRPVVIDPTATDHVLIGSLEYLVRNFI